MRHIQKIAASIALTAIGVFGVQAVAGAASANYAGTTTTTTVPTTTPPTVTPTGPTSYTVAVGASISGQVCGNPPFATGSTVTFTLNGTPVGTATAGSNGCATFTTVATDPHLSVDGSAPVAVSLGASTLAGSGTSVSGGATSGTATIVVTPAAAPSGLAFTGADILATVVGGIALIALGFLVLTFTRRRKAVTV